MIAILEAKRAGLLGYKDLPQNIIAGVIVGVVALPLAMAFAIASGAKPEQGLYTAIVAGLATSLFGGSRLQIAGPTGAFIVILSGITAQYGIEGLQIATLMARPRTQSGSQKHRFAVLGNYSGVKYAPCSQSPPGARAKPCSSFLPCSCSRHALTCRGIGTRDRDAGRPTRRN